MGSPKYGNAQGQLVHGPKIDPVGTSEEVSAPTTAEFNSLVEKFNDLLDAVKSANIIA